MQRCQKNICICKEDGTAEKRAEFLLKLGEMEILVYNTESAILADNFEFITLVSVDKEYNEGINRYTEIKIKLKEGTEIVERADV